MCARACVCVYACVCKRSYVLCVSICECVCGCVGVHDLSAGYKAQQPNKSLKITLFTRTSNSKLAKRGVSGPDHVTAIYLDRTELLE